MLCEGAAADEFNRDIDALERITGQFLGYAQGQSHVGFGEEWPVNEVLSRIVSSYAMQDIRVEYAESDVNFSAPDLAVQRAVTNLIDNALEYGQAPVEVTLNQQANEVRLTVWDNGKGLSEDEFVLACQPFSRLSGDRNASGHCGLGLAIAEQIARQTRGELRAGLQDVSGKRFGIAMVWSVNR
jgi:two-component system, OmpR family, osmolarity sensor histidine kinase EnvZ